MGITASVDQNTNHTTSEDDLEDGNAVSSDDQMVKTERKDNRRDDQLIESHTSVVMTLTSTRVFILHSLKQLI